MHVQPDRVIGTITFAYKATFPRKRKRASLDKDGVEDGNTDALQHPSFGHLPFRRKPFDEKNDRRRVSELLDRWGKNQHNECQITD